MGKEEESEGERDMHFKSYRPILLAKARIDIYLEQRLAVGPLRWH